MNRLNTLIRPMKLTDLNEVVHLHLKAFPGFFLTNMGKNFLFELYKNFLRSNSSICLVAEIEKSIAGFAVGNLNPNGFFKKVLIRRGIVFLYYSLGALVKNPFYIAKRLFYALFYRGEQPVTISNAALLSSLGVNPGNKKNGVGTQLISTFCKTAFSRGAHAVYLITDRMNNDETNLFYIRKGFNLESVFENADGRKMNRYIKFSDEKSL